ncbi:MAG: carboxypeptidase-like regulatory domain-containing protein [Planctomycetaceae bacterium]|jgi:uncharacterized protein YcfL|nr:carboxypeptidase-like regulatory domain-containing protein [Planctomycetaceae bacterium]
MKLYQTCFLFLICVVFSGCGSSGLKGLVPCSGVLLEDGKPVDGVSIAFIPVAETSETKTANAITDTNGKFSAVTVQWNGIQAGKYNVTLSKRITTVNPNQESVPENYRSVTYIEQMGKYANAETSGLTIEIPNTGNNDIKIEIKR